MTSDTRGPFGLRLETRHTCHPNGDILLETLMNDDPGGPMRAISSFIIKTSDAAVRKSLIALGWTPPGGRPGRRVVAGPGLTGGGSDPREVRNPIGSSYPLAYRLVTENSGNGSDVIRLEGLHIVNNQRQWIGLPTQDSTWSEDHIPSFLSI